MQPPAEHVQTKADRPPRPTALGVKPGGIPIELKGYAHWLVWSYFWKETDRKWDKPPRSARTGRICDGTKPEQWCDFDTALAAAGRHDGIGFAVSTREGHEDPFVALDLDGCCQGGAVEPWAREILDATNSYAELSPGGAGVRIFCIGRVPKNYMRKPIEVYQSGHYLTVTGHHLDGTPWTVNECPQALAALCEHLDREARQAPPNGTDHDRPFTCRAGSGADVRTRTVAYLAKCPPAVSGQHGHSRTLDVARAVVYGFDLGPDVGFDLLWQHYNPRCQPPWSEKELRHKCREADTKPFTKPRGWLLAGDGWRPPAGRRPPGAADEAREVEEAVDDPHRLARLYLADHRHDDGLTLRYWREEFHRWDGTAWRTVPDKEVRAELCQRIKAEFDLAQAAALRTLAEGGGSAAKKAKPVGRRVTGKLTGDVLHALAGLTLLPGAVEQPSWLDGEPEPPCPAEDILACRNGLVCLPELATGDGHLYPGTPRFFSPNVLPYDFDAAAPEPTEWLAFLAKLWPDDPQAVATLQEWFGYCLTPDTRQQKILMLVGPRRSGKGTIARVLTRLIGPANVGGPTLAGLGTNFGLWPLLSKTLAVISDARLSGRTDAALVTERLLSISGEDAQTIDRKNLSHVTAKLGARFVILTNELPKLSDPSVALVGRMIVLRLTQTWYGREDTELTDRLLLELPAILLWAVEGWKRLRERGRFVQPDSATSLIGDMEDLSSPVGAFIRDCCEVGPGYEVFVRDLFERWKRWCEEKGRKDHGNEQTFGRDLAAAVPALNVRRPRVGGDRVRTYEGIRLRPDAEPVPDDREI
jgi:putative DNA primase/helicase